MLLYSLLLKRVLQKELYENFGAYRSRCLGDVRHHHLLDCFHEIIEVCAEELPGDNGFEALKDMALRREICHVAFNDQHKSFHLCLRQVSID